MTTGLFTADRCKETSTTTGAGSFTLSGAVSGYVTWASAFAVSDYFTYCIMHTSANEFEVGTGRLTGATTLERTAFITSSTGSAVSFSAGTKVVFCAASASALSGMELGLWGDGSDGDVAISSGTTTLTRTMYYRKLTLSSTGKIASAGYLIFCHELDISAAGAAAISRDGTAGNNAASSTGASLASPLSFVVLGGSVGGVAGANGGTAAGTNGVTGSGASRAMGGSGGASGSGGSGSGGAGGTAGAQTPVSGQILTPRIATLLISGSTLLSGGGGGAGGAGGGGDGTAGGGGGSGGAGAGVVYVSARVVNRSASTAAGAIRAVGGVGGNGFSSVAGNRGGGAGGGGGGGGWLYVIIGSVYGSTATGCFDCTGGASGAGGNGFGTGVGGKSGAGGDGGRLTLFRLDTNTVTDTTGSAGTAAGNASGVTGGTSSAGGALSVSL